MAAKQKSETFCVVFRATEEDSFVNAIKMVILLELCQERVTGRVTAWY